MSNSKSSAESDRFRKLGNEFFAKRKLDDALASYNTSLVFAPQSDESFAYACGNRSAVLYEIGEYKECARDVERALLCPSCPNSLKEKLQRRKAKCEALTNKKSSSSDAEVGSIPQLCGGPNVHIPCVSGKVKLDLDGQGGRRLIATDNISAGSVLIVEKPYASILLDHTRTSHCHECHEVLPLDFISCNECTDVRFCSEACRDRQTACHWLECGQVDRLYQIGVAYLAYRIFTVSNAEDLAEHIWCKHRRRETKALYGLGQDELYDGGYRCVFNLMAHHDDVDVTAREDFEKVWPLHFFSDNSCYFWVALGLVRLLISRKDWPIMAIDLFRDLPNVCDGCKRGLERHDSDLVNRCLVPVFVRLIEILICNAHAITALARRCGTSTGDVEEMDSRKIASAIYPVASLMNHSCIPNISSSFIGKTLVVRAVKNIGVGEEILNCYGPQFGRALVEERREALRQQYYFDCACSGCTDQEYVQREACFTAVSCSKCVTKCDVDRLFGTDDHPSPMIISLGGAQYVCNSCNRRTAAYDVQVNVANAESSLTRILSRSPTKDDSTLISESIQSISVFYVHSRSGFEWRDKLAEWLIRAGSYVQAAIILMSNLATVAFIFGDDSIELANEILKLFDAVVTAVEKTPNHGAEFLGDKRKERLRMLSNMADVIFEIHDGKDCTQAKEIRSLRDQISRLLADNFDAMYI